MNHSQACALVKKLSFPVYDGDAPNGTLIPYGSFYATQPENFAADNIVYCEQWQFVFRVYTRKHDRKIEAEVKKLFKDNEIAWTSSWNYIDDQKTIETEYTFTGLGNEVFSSGE